MNKNKYIALNINPSLEIDWGLLYNDSMCAHVISDVIKDSPAGKAGLKPGERLVSINGEAIEDIFDYQYLGIGEHCHWSQRMEVRGLLRYSRTRMKTWVLSLTMVLWMITDIAPINVSSAS